MEVSKVMGLPLVIIHFHRIFREINQLGSPIYGTTYHRGRATSKSHRLFGVPVVEPAASPACHLEPGQPGQLPIRYPVISVVKPGNWTSPHKKKNDLPNPALMLFKVQGFMKPRFEPREIEVNLHDSHVESSVWIQTSWLPQNTWRQQALG